MLNFKKRTHLFSLSLILSLLFFSPYSLKASITVKNRDQLNFKINADSLSGNTMNYAGEVFEPSDFQKDRFSYIDIFNATNVDNALIIAKKTAFMVHQKASFFTEKILISTEFINRTVNDATITPLESRNQYRIEKISDMPGKKLKISGILSGFYFPNPQKAKNLTFKQLAEINKVDDNLGAPVSLFLIKMDKISDYLYTTYSVIKFFELEKDYTLVVTYSIFVLNPSDFWPIPHFLIKSYGGNIGKGETFLAEGIKSYSL